MVERLGLAVAPNYVAAGTGREMVSRKDLEPSHDRPAHGCFRSIAYGFLRRDGRPRYRRPRPAVSEQPEHGAQRSMSAVAPPRGSGGHCRSCISGQSAIEACGRDPRRTRKHQVVRGVAGGPPRMSTTSPYTKAR